MENVVPLTQGLPRAATVTVPHQGHSLITGQECARTALGCFLREDVDTTAGLARELARLAALRRGIPAIGTRPRRRGR